jgi:hypothetical protein
MAFKNPHNLSGPTTPAGTNKAKKLVKTGVNISTQTRTLDYRLLAE